MSTFVSTNKAPGVYIQEVQVAGPIAGVGTSTAAFVGPARRGPIGTPVRLANWTEFVDAFGVDDDFGPYIPQQVVYVTPAVQGFFANGGADCWFVRVGSGRRSTLALKDKAGRDTLIVTAMTEGKAGDDITVEVKDGSIASSTATRAASTLASAVAVNDTDVPVQAGDVGGFAIGDEIEVGAAANAERGTIAAITGTTLTLEAPLAGAHAAADPVRIADLRAGQTQLRIDDVTGFEPGSGASITQGATTEGALALAVDGVVKRITLSAGLKNPYTMAAGDGDVTVATKEFTLVVGGEPADENLSLDPRHSRYFAARVNSGKVNVAAADDPPNPTPPPDNLPAVLAATNLAGGENDDPAAVTASDFTAGIDALKPIDEVNILCVPDRTDLVVQKHMIDHCELMQDRFAILDPQRGVDSAAIVTQREALGSDRGYAALYYPWIVIADPAPEATGRITVPPSGHVAGLYARVDNDVGVFKAPANEAVRGALDLERLLDDGQQGPLNEKGINVIRSLRGRGVVVWGARTTSNSTQWRYVNVRRLLLFIEESLQEGTEFVVFQPNTPSLWGQVKRQVTDFLTRQWVAGALVGTTPDEAFEVQVDAELNTPSVRALGQLIILVKLYPAPPAEYVVFRIIQQPGGPVVAE